MWQLFRRRQICHSSRQVQIAPGRQAQAKQAGANVRAPRIGPLILFAWTLKIIEWTLNVIERTLNFNEWTLNFNEWTLKCLGWTLIFS